MIFTWMQMPLFMAMAAMLIAQIIKVPIYWLANKRLDMGMMFSTGGMPSSHSAMVTALSVGIGLKRGWGDDLFALSVVFAIIVMYDALGIRRHAGKHAAILNQLIQDVQVIISAIARNNAEDKGTTGKHKLKELLGHEPLEVFFGIVLGVVVAAILHSTSSSSYL